MAKILVAEDDRLTLRSIGDYLRRSGYQVEEARDEMQALECVEKNGFDLVVSDVFMPHDGFRLLAKLRSISPDLPVILMTGHSPEKLAEGRSLGAADYLMKPFGLEELATKIRRLLEDKAPSGTGAGSRNT